MTTLNYLPGLLWLGTQEIYPVHIGMQWLVIWKQNNIEIKIMLWTYLYPDWNGCEATVDNYRQVSNTRRTLVGNKIVDHSDVVGASPVGAAPTTSSFST